MIHHLSYHAGLSVNDGISRENTTVKYASVDNSVALIRSLSRGCSLAKTDIKSAFRIIPLHPSEYHLFGLHWDNKYLYDKCLAMGCASSCKIFETFSTALEWVAKCKLGCNHVTHILDDFLECKQALDRFLHCCERISVPIAHEKTMGPSQCLIFARIEHDANDLEARLPEDKLTKCEHAVRGMLGRKSVTLRELQGLIGLLNFCLYRRGSRPSISAPPY